VQSNLTAYLDANIKHLQVERCCEVYAGSRGANPEAFDIIRNSVPPGLYEHWKSEEGKAKFYIVYYAGVEQDTDRPIVSYAALYPPHTGVGTFRHLVDEENGFLTPIKRDIYEGPRFTLVCKMTVKEFAILLDYKGELAMITNPPVFRMRVGEILKKKVPLF
jgi:hypothetical protein